MLELRPNCEYCDKDLAVDANDAMICSYECTFCKDCVEVHLKNVCPNCGGGFVPRPIRPKVPRRQGVGLEHQPASTARRHLKHDKAEIAIFVAGIEGIEPEQR